MILNWLPAVFWTVGFMCLAVGPTWMRIRVVKTNKDKKDEYWNLRNPTVLWRLSREHRALFPQERLPRLMSFAGFPVFALGFVLEYFVQQPQAR